MSVLLFSRSALMVHQVEPPSRLYCHVPRLVFTATTAIASTGPSASVIDPSTTRLATETPALLMAPSRIVPRFGRNEAFRKGASLVLATTISKVSETEALEPSVAVTLTESVPTSPFAGAPENVRVAASNESQLGRAFPLGSVAAYVSVPPTSTSAKAFTETV